MLKLLIKYSFYAALLWTVTIFIVCCTPGRFIPTSNWLELLSFDKLVHASIFFVLVCLWLINLNHSGKLNSLTIFLTILLSVSYGGLLEVMQATVFSQRSGDVFDFIANSFGCLMGLWFFHKNKHRLNTAV